MVYIKYQSHTLLYGESFFWFVSSFYVAFYTLPNLGDIHSGQRLVIEYVPGWRKLLHLYNEYIYPSRAIRIVTAIAATLLQSVYSIGFILLAFFLQDDVLDYFLHIDQASYKYTLSYKSIFYGPLVYRLGICLMTGLALNNREYKTWEIHKKFHIFSVDERRQMKAALVCAIVSSFDWACQMCELFYLTYVILPIKLNRVDVRETFTWPTIGEIMALTYLGTMNIALLYRPMALIMFSTSCLSSHLHLINEQLKVYYQKYNSNDQTSRQVPQVVNETNIDEACEPGRCDISNHRMHKKEPRKGSMFQERNPMKGQLAICQDTESNQSNFKATKTIKTIYELEHHLAQLSLYVQEIDSTSPSVIFAQTAINFVATFFAIFYYIEAQTLVAKETLGYSAQLILLYISARMIPIMTMFFFGQSVKTERETLLTNLEFIYFRNEINCNTLYKQMTSSQFSLSQLFRLADSLRLKCDNLLELDLRSFLDIIVYLATSVLIVIQFDIVMLQEEPVR